MKFSDVSTVQLFVRASTRGDVETETVVTVRTRNRSGLLCHLIQTLESERIDVGYTYCTIDGDCVLLVFRTGDSRLKAVPLSQPAVSAVDSRLTA